MKAAVPGDTPSVAAMAPGYRSAAWSPRQALREATGLPLDVDGIATPAAVQTFAVVNHCLEFPEAKWKAMQERMVTKMMQMLLGGALAMRTTDETSAG